MKKLLVLLLALALSLAICACSKNDSSDSSEDESSVSDSADDSAASDTLTIRTPYAELRAPENYQDHVEYKADGDDPYTLTFYVKDDDTKLYSLIFNGKGDILLGTILGHDAYTTVYAKVYPLDVKDENYETKAEYQEGMYTILTNLRKDYDFEDNTVVKKPDTFEIITDVVTLYYPKKWEDKTDVNIEKESVSVSSGKNELFVVSFVDDGGYLLGKYQDHPIYLTIGSLDGVDPDSDTYKELSAMQEDVNVMLDTLESDPEFVSANASE